MSVRNTLFQATVKSMRSLSSSRMDLAEYELKNTLVRAQVVSNLRLAPQLRRITVSAPELGEVTLAGADEYIGLLLPQPDQPLAMPDPSIDNIRAAVKELPEATRPDLRWYTVRHLRADAHELDIDIVTHGDSGPGSAWALRATPGSEVGIRFISACHYPHEGPQLYVADPTAMPALRAIVESMPAGTRGQTHVVCVSPSPDLLEPGELPATASFTLIDAPPTSAVDELGAALGAVAEAHNLSYAWLCGESSLATTARRILVKQHGMEKKKIFFSGYWKLGAART